MTKYDVITFGETMLRLTPPHFQRLEQATQLEIEVGGTESNTAVGLARLGLKVAWLSRLPASPLGRLVVRALAGYGVDTSHVIWAGQGERMGLYFYERGKMPRGSRVIYDRKESAISHIRPEQLPDQLFSPDGARLLHLTGITPALSPGAAAAARRALDLARAGGWTITFDLNYRGKLWDMEAAREGCQPFIQAADIFFLPLRDAILFFDLPSNSTPEDAVLDLADRYPRATIVMTLGNDGAIANDRTSGKLLRQPAFPADEVGRLGAGDAFTAGFIYSYLEAGDLAQALRWGTAAAALKYTVPGDIPVIQKSEIESLLMAERAPTRLSR